MPDALTSLELPADWFLLLLRVLFIFLIYFFLYQLFRVQLRELLVLGTTTATAASPAHRLIVMEGGETPGLVGQSFLLRPSNSVGRNRESVIALDEPFVSSNHAEIAYSGGGWWVTDFGSTNGTAINDQPVNGTAGMQPGDIVQFGRVKLRLEA
jgi:hypothetical protein